MNAFSLPTFQGSKCRQLSVCADLPKRKPFLRSIEKNGPYVASYRASHGKAHIRVLCHDTSLHTDIASPGYFDKGAPPDNYTIGKLQELLGKTDEVDVPVRVGGWFRVPFSSLPENGLVRSLQHPPTEGKISLSLTEAKFELDGTSLLSIRWTLNKEDDEAEIALMSRIKRKIRGDYFVDSLQYIERQFNTVILGRK